MTTWLFLYACLGLGWGIHNAGPSCSAGSQALKGTGDSPQLGWHLLVLSLSLFMYSCPLFLHFSSLSAPSHTLYTWMFHSPFACKNSLYCKCLFGQAQPPGKSLLGSPRCRWLERVKIRSSSCLLVRSERAEASRKSFTCQLSVRRQPSPPRRCPCHRGVTRL